MTLVRCHCAQVPDIKTETNSVHAVLVDEEAVGSVDAPGRGAKILSGDGVLEQFLHETKSGDHMVCFSEAPHTTTCLYRWTADFYKRMSLSD